MTNKTYILDYNCGNVKSVERAFYYLCYQVDIGFNNFLGPDSLLIKTGLGHFGSAMKYMNHLNKKLHQLGGNILAICLGMQLLFESSEEPPSVNGLGLIKGRILSNRKNNLSNKIHLGWGSSKFLRSHDRHDMYYVHQYFCEPMDSSNITEIFTLDNRAHCGVKTFKNI